MHSEWYICDIWYECHIQIAVLRKIRNTAVIWFYFVLKLPNVNTSHVSTRFFCNINKISGKKERVI